MDDDLIFYAIFGSVLAYFAYSVVRHRGFKAAMFGAKIVSSVGQVSVKRRGLISQKLRVHILGGGAADRAVGLELSSSAPGAWSMTPISLSVSEAAELVALLEEALEHRAVRDSTGA
jgi:hypothetical protein